jgi:rare lipoprotein A
MRELAAVWAFLALAGLAACVGTMKEPATSQAPDMQPRALSSTPSGTEKGPVAAIAPVHPAPSTPQSPPVREPAYRETGIAGWYGKEFQGKKTASGKVFDMEDFSAAHRTLPLGTVVRVTNLDNLKSVDVKIIDRGPFVKNRILDLSYGAARELGFLESGTARVKVETLAPVHGATHYTVQAAAFTEEENARLLKERLSKKFELVYIVQTETSIARLYHVRIGSYASKERAKQVAGKLLLEGLEPVVLRKDN